MLFSFNKCPPPILINVDGKDNGLYVDFSKHPAFGDTFEIYVVKKDGFPVTTSGTHADADSEKAALKSVLMIAKKHKKLFLKQGIKNEKTIKRNIDKNRWGTFIK